MDLPLFGKTLLLTRPIRQAEESRPLFEKEGATVFIQPALEIVPTEENPETERILADLSCFDRIIFSSGNGVEFFLKRLATRNSLTLLKTIPLAAIGPGTAAELKKNGFLPDAIPANHSAEGMTELLADEAKRGLRFLSVRGDRGRAVLKEGLTAFGGRFAEIAVYRSEDVKKPDGQIIRLMEENQIDVVVVTSSATAAGVVRLFGESLRKTRLASISPLTSDALRRLGFPPAIEASEATISGILDATIHFTVAESGF